MIELKGGEMMAQGKQSDQKMKPYLVYEYLMRKSDIIYQFVTFPQTLKTHYLRKHQNAL